MVCGIDEITLAEFLQYGRAEGGEETATATSLAPTPIEALPSLLMASCTTC
jgi:hypothetical protein